MNCTLIPIQPPSARVSHDLQRRMPARRVAGSVLLALALIAGITPAAHAQNTAPASLTNTLLHGTITASTGGLPGSGSFSQLFTADTDYNIALNNSAPAAPASYLYTVLDADSATIVETAVTVALEFTSGTAGTFAATFTAGGTQSGTFTLEVLSSPPLVNISTRTTLSAGANAIAGLSVAGDQPRRLLIRVVGPGLADFDVPNPLPDPKFTVFRGAESVGANDNWDIDADNRDHVREAEASAGAFALMAASADAATVVELQPGLYTIVGSSVSSETAGEILIEAFLID